MEVIYNPKSSLKNILRSAVRMRAGSSGITSAVEDESTRRHINCATMTNELMAKNGGGMWEVAWKE